MRELRVLVWKEEVSNSDSSFVWLAQAIDEDMATQGSNGVEPLGEAVAEVVESLGLMFDARDEFIKAQEDRIEALPEAPSEFADEWEAGTPLGEQALGSKRRAKVRLANRNPYLVWRANRDAEKQA